MKTLIPMILKKAISLALTILCLFGQIGLAQETLVDLNSNPLLGAWEEAERRYQNSGRAAGDTLDLPFFDDFSEPFSRLNHPHDLYPDPARWLGKTVYVNNHMAINPISQGVATFDGLDENGLAYGFGFSTPTLADSLTSKPINLSSAPDTVFLSFFYQAQGMGNAPETEDVLALEFKDTGDVWQRVWQVEGYILEDYAFNRVMLPVQGDEYLFNGFQFRFLNYASRAGSVDHWHIDYVELDGARTSTDTVINDVSYMSQTSFSKGGALVSQTASLLRDYSSMPWSHYVTDTLAFMLDTLHIELRNNFEDDKQLRFIYRVRDENESVVYAYENVSGIQVFGNAVCGSELNDCNDDQFSNFRTSLNEFYFPPTSQEDSVYFLVEYVIDTINDAIPENDKQVFKQVFYNYYAYDDGTAELAYGLGNLENEGKVGVRYDIKKSDSLQAIQIYLNPVNIDISQEPVKLMVWSGGSEPDQVLYESPDFITLEYSEGINYFYNYELENAIWIEGGSTIWVGWTQQAATGVIFSVGFDQRKDNSDRVFYNLGTTWNQSSIPGSVMIRPTFGNPYDWVSGVHEVEEGSVAVYPNPTTGEIYLKESSAGELRNAQVSVFDLSGRVVLSQVYRTNTIDMSALQAGTYILTLQTENGRVLSNRIVLQP